MDSYFYSCKISQVNQPAASSAARLISTVVTLGQDPGAVGKTLPETPTSYIGLVLVSSPASIQLSVYSGRQYRWWLKYWLPAMHPGDLH